MSSLVLIRNRRSTQKLFGEPSSSARDVTPSRTTKTFKRLSRPRNDTAAHEVSDWSSAQIQSRAKKLSAAALKIWTLPEEFNSVLPSVEENFDLDSDFAALTGKKPATLSIFNKEIKVTTWISLLHAVAQQLYAHDANIFRRAIQSVAKSFFTTEPTKYKIDAALYLKKDVSSKDCLKRTKALVEKFDRLDDTDIKNEIWFTLRRE